MAWYGPSGECGCCDQAGGCQCVPACECTDPENKLFALIGKRFTISGFPAVIELKWSAPRGISWPGEYYDVYMFVSGLDKFNGTYNLIAGSVYSEQNAGCPFGIRYDDTVFVQYFRTLDPQWGSSPCTAGLTEIFSGTVALSLYVNDDGEWRLRQNPGGPFYDPRFSGDGTDLFDFVGPCSANNYCKDSKDDPNVIDPAVVNVIAPPDISIPSGFGGTICYNNSYIFRLEYYMEHIKSDFRDKTIAGWNIAVSEIPNQIYLRNFISDPTDAIRVDGVDILNGEYFLPSILSKCAPADFEEEVSLPYTQMIISETSPCFIVEGGATGTIQARFKHEYNEVLKRSKFSLEFDVPYVIGTFPFSYSGEMQLDCTAECFERKEVQNICFPTYDQVVFKVCHTPQIE